MRQMLRKFAGCAGFAGFSGDDTSVSTSAPSAEPMRSSASTPVTFVSGNVSVMGKPAWYWR
jgi:hypothetical protein